MEPPSLLAQPIAQLPAPALNQHSTQLPGLVSQPKSDPLVLPPVAKKMESPAQTELSQPQPLKPPQQMELPEIGEKPNLPQQTSPPNTETKGKLPETTTVDYQPNNKPNYVTGYPELRDSVKNDVSSVQMDKSKSEKYVTDYPELKNPQVNNPTEVALNSPEKTKYSTQVNLPDSKGLVEPSRVGLSDKKQTNYITEYPALNSPQSSMPITATIANSKGVGNPTQTELPEKRQTNYITEYPELANPQKSSPTAFSSIPEAHSGLLYNMNLNYKSVQSVPTPSKVPTTPQTGYGKKADSRTYLKFSEI